MIGQVASLLSEGPAMLQDLRDIFCKVYGFSKVAMVRDFCNIFKDNAFKDINDTTFM